MTSVIEQSIQILTLLVEYTRSFANVGTADRTNLEDLSALVALVYEIHECIDYPTHWRQEAFLLQIVVERTSADVCPGYVWTDGIETDLLLGQIFPVRSNEPYRTTEQKSALVLYEALPDSRMVCLLFCSGVYWECCAMVSILYSPRSVSYLLGTQ